MSPSFAEIAPHYDALRPLSAGDRTRLQAMLLEASPGNGDVVVEVGCGTGWAAECLDLHPPARRGLLPERLLSQHRHHRSPAFPGRRGAAQRATAGGLQ